jgi:1,4-dihydroxy-2-naphthoate octaprenyltransferase
LAVKVGKRPAKAIYFAMIWLPMLVLVPYSLIYPATFFTWAVLFLLIPATLIVATAKTPRELILALKLTSFASLLYAVLFGLGLAQINFAL